MENDAQPGVPTSSADQVDDASAENGAHEAGAVLVTRENSEFTDAAGSSTLTPESTLAGLPLLLDVTIPIPSFRVSDLLSLEKGEVLATDWAHTEDVPVWCGGSQLAWTEFEVVDNKLAIRVTRVS